MSANARISLLLSDVDGTLVTHDKVLTSRTKRAVAALKDASVALAFTSGRPPKGMEMLIGPLAIVTPIAGFNGGLFTEPDLKPIEERKLPGDVAREIVQLILSEGLDAWLYAGNDWLVRKKDAPHVDRETETVKFPPKVVADFDDSFDQAVKVVGVSDEHDRIRRCANDIQVKFGAKVTAATSQPYYLDVTHPLANKGAVVAYLGEHLGIATDEIATIGDGANDVAMFERGGFAIAMGNADDEVKAAADAVTADCDNEGFAEAVERFVLPRAKGSP